MSNPIDPEELELNALEAALGSIHPTRARVDRDLILYRAGQASIVGSKAARGPWIAVAAGLGLVASGEALMLARRPPAEVVERVVVVHEPAPSPTVLKPEVAGTPSLPDRGPGLGQTDHERLAVQLLRYGLDGLPGPRSSSTADLGPASVPSRRRLQEELRRTLFPGDPS